eukprot:2161092-Rhodomonas_salina.2
MAEEACAQQGVVESQNLQRVRLTVSFLSFFLVFLTVVTVAAVLSLSGNAPSPSSASASQPVSGLEGGAEPESSPSGLAIASSSPSSASVGSTLSARSFGSMGTAVLPAFFFFSDATIAASPLTDSSRAEVSLRPFGQEAPLTPRPDLC